MQLPPGRTGLMLRLAFWGPGVVLFGVAASRPAAADIIDQYVPTTLPGFAVAPGVTVNSRSRNGYDPQGVPVGDFIVRPGFGETFGYDSNPNGLAHARGSAVVITQASIAAASTWSRNSLGAAVTVSDSRYPSLPKDNVTDWTASIGGTLDIGRDQATWTASHSALTESPLSVGVIGITRPVPYTVDQAGVSYRIGLNRLSFEPSLLFTSSRFSTVSGVPNQSFQNNDTLQPTVTTRYELGPLRYLVAVVRGTEISYTSAVTGTAKRNSTGYSVLGGVELDFGTLQTRLLAGYQQRYYVSSQYGSPSAPLVEGSATWTPTGIYTITARLSRSIDDAATSSIAFYTETGASLGIDYELRRNVLLHAQTSVQQAAYGQGGGNSTQVAGSLGASWLINRTGDLSATYSYLDTRNSQSNSYTDSVLLLRLGLKL